MVIFLSSVISFLIVAFVLFMIIKGINSLGKKKEEAPAAAPAPTEDQKLLMEIRDLLKTKTIYNRNAAKICGVFILISGKLLNLQNT